MLGWDCETCGRGNALKHRSCAQCGAARPVGPGVPDERRRVVEDIIRRGSAELTERYGIPVQVTRIGGMERLTVEEARQLVAETEADIQLHLSELRPDEAA